MFVKEILNQSNRDSKSSLLRCMIELRSPRQNPTNRWRGRSVRAGGLSRGSNQRRSSKNEGLKVV